MLIAAFSKNHPLRSTKCPQSGFHKSQRGRIPGLKLGYLHPRSCDQSISGCPGAMSHVYTSTGTLYSPGGNKAITVSVVIELNIPCTPTYHNKNGGLFTKFLNRHQKEWCERGGRGIILFGRKVRSAHGFRLGVSLILAIRW